jgi:hypothetical protein
LLTSKSANSYYARPSVKEASFFCEGSLEGLGGGHLTRVAVAIWGSRDAGRGTRQGVFGRLGKPKREF